ncbi:helix-turn-helix domain-containing protein [Flammeovirga sp. EKP202]|uniref:AraC family transcriptional regulator n=1 Tax=Flammeovirga sp. EKP202 TaxID=2770592 RepID=UPI00165FD53C|nr:helix-turn-helix domain-containing protein [Flammeovirga sp. EKP202]MBD0403335.1 helix-turn-helix domain-containing protein [Flammeovirga sp. EKP202]
MHHQNISYHQNKKLGKGLPFAIVPSSILLEGTDIFSPSKRDFHVLFWFKKGTGTYYIDFQEYTFQPNTLMLLSKDQISYFDTLDPEEVEIQSIVFTPEFLYRNDHDLQHMFQFSLASHIEGMQYLSLSEKNSTFFNLLSEHMFEVYDHWKLPQQEHAFYHWLSLFLIQVERIQKQHQTIERLSSSDQLYLKFQQLLEQNFKKEFKVEFYLKTLGINIKALSKILKEKYDLSPKAVIDERRILEIKRLLKGTSIPIKEIAYDMGFDEPTNMVKYFKKRTSLTPNAFRKE